MTDFTLFKIVMLTIFVDYIFTLCVNVQQRENVKEHDCILHIVV